MHGMVRSGSKKAFERGHAKVRLPPHEMTKGPLSKSARREHSRSGKTRSGVVSKSPREIPDTYNLPQEHNLAGAPTGLIPRRDD